MVYRLSPTSLSLMKECKRCFWLTHRKNLRRPDSIFPSLPNGIDRILKDYFDSFMRKGILPPELSNLENVKLFDNEGILSVWRNNLKGIQWTDKKGNLFKGAIDNILVKNNKLIVLDYKTRGYALRENTHHHYQDQIDLYNFLLRKIGHETEDYGYLLFYYPDKVGENGDMIFHNSLIKIDIDIRNAEKIVDTAINVLEGDIPESQETCNFCGWLSKINNNNF